MSQANDERPERGENEASSLFPAWSDTVFRLALGVLALGALAIPATFWAWERTPYVRGTDNPKDQPVKFDHRHHVRDDGIPCLYCHGDAARTAYAGVPAASLCMGCHNQIWTESPELEPVRRAYFEGTPLAWERVTRLPHFVFFDHASHVTRGVSCVTCHGRVDSMAEVYAVEPFTMRFCLDCHRSPESRLRPRAEVASVDFQASPAASARVRAELTADPVHPGVDCTTCHR